jgi:hypothetical protein
VLPKNNLISFPPLFAIFVTFVEGAIVNVEEMVVVLRSVIIRNVTRSCEIVTARVRRDNSPCIIINFYDMGQPDACMGIHSYHSNHEGQSISL